VPAWCDFAGALSTDIKVRSRAGRAVDRVQNDAFAIAEGAEFVLEIEGVVRRGVVVAVRGKLLSFSRPPSTSATR